MIIDSKPVTAVLVASVILLNIRAGYFKNFKAGFKNLRGKTYLIFFAAVLGLFTVTLSVDRTVLKFIQSQKTGFGPVMDDIGGFLSQNTHFWFVLCILFFISLALKKEKLSRVFFGSVLSAALTSIGSQLLKFTLVRARPYSQEGPFSFFNYSGIREHAYQSLPSGDVAVVGGAAAFLFYSVKNVFWRVVALFMILCTAYYRVNEDKHWPSDTLISASLGFLFALMILDLKKNDA